MQLCHATIFIAPYSQRRRLFWHSKAPQFLAWGCWYLRFTAVKCLLSDELITFQWNCLECNIAIYRDNMTLAPFFKARENCDELDEIESAGIIWNKFYWIKQHTQSYCLIYLTIISLIESWKVKEIGFRLINLFLTTIWFQDQNLYC